MSARVCSLALIMLAMVVLFSSEPTGVFGDEPIAGDVPVRAREKSFRQLLKPSDWATRAFVLTTYPSFPRRS